MSKYVTPATITTLAIALGMGAFLALNSWAQGYHLESGNAFGGGMSHASKVLVRKHNECASMRDQEGKSTKTTLYGLMTVQVMVEVKDGKLTECEHKLAAVGIYR